MQSSKNVRCGILQPQKRFPFKRNVTGLTEVVRKVYPCKVCRPNNKQCSDSSAPLWSQSVLRSRIQLPCDFTTFYLARFTSKHPLESFMRELHRTWMRSQYCPCFVLFFVLWFNLLSETLEWGTSRFWTR